MSEELKLPARPFCGDGPLLTDGYEGPRVSCENKKCKVRPRTDNYENAAEAVAAWTPRCASPDARREALDEVTAYCRMLMDCTSDASRLSAYEDVIEAIKHAPAIRALKETK